MASMFIFRGFTPNPGPNPDPRRVFDPVIDAETQRQQDRVTRGPPSPQPRRRYLLDVPREGTPRLEEEVEALPSPSASGRPSILAPVPDPTQLERVLASFSVLQNTPYGPLRSPLANLIALLEGYTLSPTEGTPLPESPVLPTAELTSSDDDDDDNDDDDDEVVAGAAAAYNAEFAAITTPWLTDNTLGWEEGGESPDDAPEGSEYLLDEVEPEWLGPHDGENPAWRRLDVGGICPICREPVPTGDEVAYAQPCGHGFGRECLEHWIEVGWDVGENAGATCPLCRVHMDGYTTEVAG